MKFETIGWKTSQYKKSYQRKFNWYIKKINKVMENDNLWRGRFVVKQYWTDFYKYDDNSGYNFYAAIYFVDKKTGRISNLVVDDWYMLLHSFTYGIVSKLNNFIINDCYEDTWANQEELYSDKTDYTLIDDSKMIYKKEKVTTAVLILE